jgi:RNA polymerase sigma-70 factor (ECF subfamily)
MGLSRLHPAEETVDRSLVERAQEGDRQAFTELAVALSDRLFPVAHRILRDWDAAGDALQVTLLRIWQDLPSLRDPDLLLAWSYRALVHACHDDLRKRRRRAPTIRLLAVDGAVDGDPAISIADRELLDRAFRALTSEHRAVIVLQYYRDLSLPDIAEILNLPLGTVRSRLHYAKRAMRAAIDADDRPASDRGRSA